MRRRGHLGAQPIGLPDGRWLTDLLRQGDARLRLESIDFDQPLAALYANVSLEA